MTNAESKALSLRASINELAIRYLDAEQDSWEQDAVRRQIRERELELTELSDEPESEDDDSSEEREPPYPPGGWCWE